MEGRQRQSEGASERAREAARLVAAVAGLGFPEEFGQVLARELGGPWSMRRMTSYLLGARPTRPEDVADELVAILAERDRLVEQHRSEHANASVTAFYNLPGRPAGGV